MKPLPLLSWLALMVLALALPSARAEMTTIEPRWTGTIEIVREGVFTGKSPGTPGVAISVRQRVLYTLDGSESAAYTVEHRETMASGGVDVPANGQGSGRAYAGAGFVDDGQGGRFYKRGWYIVAHGAPMLAVVDVPKPLEEVEVAPGTYLQTPDDYRDQQTHPITLVIDGAPTNQRLDGSRTAEGLVQSVFLGQMDGTETVTWRLLRTGAK